tara:strand:- start:636 stop:1046 length:411 start_codon:yes stop_codon:yes gene_type:complete
MAFNSKVNTLFIPGELNCAGGAADHFTWKVAHPMVVHRVEFVASLLFAADQTSAVVSLDFTNVVDSVSRAEKATITLAEAVAVGATTEPSSFTPFFVQDTDILHFEHKTQAADSGTAAGKGFFILYYESIPDNEVA